MVSSIKILLSDLDFSQIQFGFTDLLSIIMALFAVWISINFYHKNNETSNKFYNNTYTFTKDISETLGRIEERFGEKLESLKEENKTLSNRVERYYTGGGAIAVDKEKDEKKEKEIQARLEKELAEKNTLLDQFAKKYKIAEQDKNQFIQLLNSKIEEVRKLEKKLSLFENSPNRIDVQYKIPMRIISYIRNRFRRDKELRQIFCIPDILDDDEIRLNFREMMRNFNTTFLLDLEKFELINEDKILTDSGLRIFKEIADDIERQFGRQHG